MKAPQLRLRCKHCNAQWWWSPGSVIHPMDHTRADGRECRKGNPVAPAPRPTPRWNIRNIP